MLSGGGNTLFILKQLDHMHEISLLEGLLETIETQAQQQSFHKVAKVVLEVGQLSCVEPEALRFGFKVVMQGSLAEAAELSIIEVEGMGRCRQCGNNTPVDSWYAPCVNCGHPFVDIEQGTEMRLKDLWVK